MNTAQVPRSKCNLSRLLKKLKEDGTTQNINSGNEIEFEKGVPNTLLSTLSPQRLFLPCSVLGLYITKLCSDREFKLEINMELLLLFSYDTLCVSGSMNFIQANLPMLRERNQMTVSK